MLTRNFELWEFLPKGMKESDCPDPVRINLGWLARDIMQPVRDEMGLPIIIHSGYRPPEHNAAVGGAATSDHQTGRACDFHVSPGKRRTWEENTISAFRFALASLLFGQLIWEDHRIANGNRGSLWIHASIPTAKHPGTPADPSRILVSFKPRHYERYSDNLEPLA
ncbi:MAG: D-Ala-D-Ala carboxypeptidase family metallohydrolase [Phycisphaerales bacterium]